MTRPHLGDDQQVRQVLHRGRQAGRVERDSHVLPGARRRPGEQRLEHPQRRRDHLVGQPQPQVDPGHPALDARPGDALHPAQVVRGEQVPGGAQHVGAHPAAGRLLGEHVGVRRAGRHPHAERPRGQRGVLRLHAPEQPHDVGPVPQAGRREPLGGEPPAVHAVEGVGWHAAHPRTGCRTGSVLLRREVRRHPVASRNARPPSAVGRTADTGIDRRGTPGHRSARRGAMSCGSVAPPAQSGCMRTRRRRTARLSHHPVVHCESLGKWQWQCGCGARGSSFPSGWQGALTAALVHQSQVPGE